MRKHFKASVFFQKESKTTTLTKSKPSGHVLSCSAMFNDLLRRRLCKMAWMRKHFTLKPVFFFRKESKTTKLTKSKPCSHVLSCSAVLDLLLWRGLCTKEVKVCIIILDFPWAFLLS